MDFAVKVFAKIQLLALLFIVLGTIACQSRHSAEPVSAPSPDQSADCRTIEHDQGETQVCGQPQRIVVLGPYVLEPLLALGVQPVAYADHVAFYQGDYDQPEQQIPYLGQWITQPLANLGSAFNPSIEAIVKLQPDLILGLSGNNADQYATFSEIAPTLLLNWEKPQQNLETIAQIVDRTEQAADLLQNSEQKIAAARESFAAVVEAHPKLLLLTSSQFPAIYLGTQAGLCSSLPKALGFELVSRPQYEPEEPDTAPQVPISLELLPQLNEADSIILLGSNFSEIQSLDSAQLDSTDEFKTHQLSHLQQAWAENPIAQSLNASKAGRVYFIPAYLCLGLTGTIGTELYLDEFKTQLLPSQP